MFFFFQVDANKTLIQIFRFLALLQTKIKKQVEIQRVYTLDNFFAQYRYIKRGQNKSTDFAKFDKNSFEIIAQTGRIVFTSSPEELVMNCAKK